MQQRAIRLGFELGVAAVRTVASAFAQPTELYGAPLFISVYLYFSVLLTVVLSFHLLTPCPLSLPLCVKNGE